MFAVYRLCACGARPPAAGHGVVEVWCLIYGRSRATELSALMYRGLAGPIMVLLLLNCAKLGVLVWG